MNIYRFTLPKADNSGQGMDLAFVRLRKLILELAGGYSWQPDVQGVWKDDDGQVYADAHYVLDVATIPEIAERILNEGVRALWPDQLSFMIALVGIADFVPGAAQISGNVSLALPSAA